jgi:two-component system response regulator ResD
MPAAAKVLICDEADGFRQRLEEALREAGAEVAACATWGEAAGLAERERPDAILVDMLTPAFDVDELVRMRNAAPDALLAVVSSRQRDDGASDGGTGGIDLVLSRRDSPGVIAGALLERLSSP